MLWWSAFGVLGVALFGLVMLIASDVWANGWRSWVRTINSWQGTLGTVAGFLSASGVLMLSTAIQQDSEIQRANAKANAIGLALAYEVERMIAPLQYTYHTATGVDRTSEDLVDHCVLLVSALHESMIDTTPVYNAVLGNTLDFGAFNLALFTRFYSFYVDFRRELGNDPEELCGFDPGARIDYLLIISEGGFGYYDVVRASYPGVTPLQDIVIADIQVNQERRAQ